MLATVFGFVDIEGNRQYREAILIVGKKNGKSLLASAIGLYMQLADSEPGPEVYAVATKRDQAKIIWSEAKRMVQKSPTLLKRVRPLVSEIASDYNDGVFKPLSSDSDTLDGLNVHCALLDEIHQWKNGRQLYDIIADGMSAREQPLFITSTAGKIREDLYDESTRKSSGSLTAMTILTAITTTASSRSSTSSTPVRVDRPTCWKKANPGLGTIKSYRTLAEKVEKAKANPCACQESGL